MNLKTLQVDPW